ncbi:Fe(2+)/alpha-ketoglutarate-dependent dioxygenase LpxO [Klebsiella pneumoniae subsp. ozaenae]|uniref:Fe(2+)/alpha-ketoglutarate-dependent dioxygenase LpxO n=1 Tax=Klebsiella pneumoniae subsp. ozaenae TaxID=574 RepID=A0A377Z7J2_KLEPO|nr:Fe(2+)/alpha-ketoglutarate-dependent dioxygenase LpxO [Klebsiella pneumoniae subsp. ozaenae]
MSITADGCAIVSGGSSPTIPHLPAPLNGFMYLFSRVPNTPYLRPEMFPELAILQQNWQVIRDEGLHLQQLEQIKAADKYNDAGFNSFFKTGWKRFYLKWYEDAHPSASQLCPQTTALLRDIPSGESGHVRHSAGR